MTERSLEQQGNFQGWDSLRQGTAVRWVLKASDSVPHAPTEEIPTPERLRAFLLARDFYSNPEVLIFVASNEAEAEGLFVEKLALENYDRSNYGPLTELDLTSTSLTVLQPPGDRNLR